MRGSSVSDVGLEERRAKERGGVARAAEGAGPRRLACPGAVWRAQARAERVRATGRRGALKKIDEGACGDQPVKVDFV